MEKREAKVKEFINLRLGYMSVLDYILKFINSSKYAPSLVSHLKDEIRHFVMGVSDNLKEECCSTMIRDTRNISHRMVHAQQVEDTRVNRKCRDAKRARSFVCGSSKGRLDIQKNPRLNKRSSNQVPTIFPKAHDDRVSNPKSQKG